MSARAHPFSPDLAKKNARSHAGRRWTSHRPTDSYDLSRKRCRQPHEGNDVRDAQSPPNEASIRLSVHRIPPPLGWPTCHPARFSGSRFSDRSTYLLSRSASTTFGGARLTTLRLVTPSVDKDETPRGQRVASVVKCLCACLVVRDFKLKKRPRGLLGNSARGIEI